MGYEGLDLTRRQFTWGLGLFALGQAGAAHAGAPAKGGAHGAAKGHSGGESEQNPVARARRSEAEHVWEELLEGNKRFVANAPRLRSYVPTREELARGQSPKVIVLTCSDSRVSPTLVFDRNLGDLFVIRTAGNIADRVALGSIEYAVEHLHSPVLLVLGHDKCGAVAAAASGERMPTPNLRAIVKHIAPVVTPLRARANGPELVALGVEANIHQSARNILEKSPIVREHVQIGKLTLYKAVYRLGTGEVKPLGEAQAPAAKKATRSH